MAEAEEQEKNPGAEQAPEPDAAPQDRESGTPRESRSLDADGAEQAAPQDPADPRDAEIAALGEKLKAAEDRALRALADFDNYRKRSLREREEFARIAAADAIKAVLPTADNLARALESAPPDDPLAKGVKLSLDGLEAALVSQGAEKIDAAGKPFDPNLHEALAQSPSADVPAGTVSQVFRAGWLLNGRLIRAAQVIVSSGPAEAKEAE